VSTAATDDAINDEVFGLRHMMLRNALYHQARRRWLDGWSRFYNLVVILGGTSAAADLLRPQGSNFTFALGMVLALVGALQLVFDFAGRARTHEILQKRYFDLLAGVECVINPKADNCAGWRGDIARLAAEEPPVLRALDAICDNQATFALSGGEKPRLKITPWQSVTRHLFAHNNGRFPDMTIVGAAG